MTTLSASHPASADGSDQRMLERLLEAHQAVTRALDLPGSAEAIAPGLLRSLCESLGFCWGALWEVDENNGVLRLSCTWQSTPAGFETLNESCRGTQLSWGQDLPGTVWASAAPGWIGDVAADHSHHCAVASAAGLRSAYALPIRISRTVSGVVELFTREPAVLDVELLRCLDVIGCAIGQGLQHKRSQRARCRFGPMLDSAIDFASVVFDLNGVILSASHAVEQIFRLTPANLVHQPLTLVIPDYRRYLSENGCSGAPASWHLPLQCLRMQGRRRSGESVPLEISLVPFVENDSPVIAAIIRDVTNRAMSEEEQKTQARNLLRSEAALRRQTRLVQSVVTSLGDGVIASDETGEVLLFNPVAAGLLGDQWASSIPSPEILNLQGYGYFLPDQHTPCPIDLLPLNRAVRGENVDGEELFVKTPSRPEGFWLNGTARPIIDQEDGLRGGVLVFRDVTEQKTARLDLRRAKEEAEAANRAKSDFLSRMSHDLRTPMNSIYGFAQLLEDESLTPSQCEAVTQILQASRHLLGLINEVLDLSRVEAGRLNLHIETLRPLQVIRAAMELITPLAVERNIALVAPPPCDAGWNMQADRQRVQQILVNLLGNAVKYNREGGQVRLSIEAMAGQRLRINVADTGPGIAPEHFSKLFVPFERLGAEGSAIEGTGLGLAYSKRLTTAMGGSIGLQSEVGKGSVFWIEFPSSVSEGPAAPASLQPSRGEGDTASFDMDLTRVLCIQPDQVSFRQIETIFTRLPGYQLVSAELGRAGLQMAVERAPDIVLLDLEVPDMEGMEVLMELRKQLGRQTPIIVVSAGLTPDIEHRALDAGARCCIAKPFHTRTFLDAITCLL